MRRQSYLLDTNIIIGLEDNRTVDAAYAKFSSLAATHKIDVFVHAAARDDVSRDKDLVRRRISFSKIQKYRILERQNGIGPDDLKLLFGEIRKPNDLVDCVLLYALYTDTVDFVVTQDKGLHERALRHSGELGRRVLFVGDAVELLTQTYEPKAVPVRHVAAVTAYAIDSRDAFFESLRDDYPEFDDWWRNKCVRQHRDCWVIYDNDRLAGLIVRKDETASDTDAISKRSKILKICTFKVAPDKRGVKLGELLLKKVLWHCQANFYELAYLTTFENQSSLINLLEFYGFRRSGLNARGELVYEREFSFEPLKLPIGMSYFEAARKHYPRFVVDTGTRSFGIPIKEAYHDVLFPDLWKPIQSDLFNNIAGGKPLKPGNTIRKVYLCRAPSNLGPSGSVLFFYKGSSINPPSQAITAVGVLESVTLAHSTRELMQFTGGRSVYSELELDAWRASALRPVKVINYLIVAYIEPATGLKVLKEFGVIKKFPPQSIFEICYEGMQKLLSGANLNFGV